MLIVTYDPIFGEAIADGLIEHRVALDIFESVNCTRSVTTGSTLYIKFLRLAIKEKKIYKEDVQIIFNGELIRLTDSGRVEYWPKGFCEVFDIVLERLLS